MHKVAYKNMSASSSHGFDPYSAWCVLSNAAKGKTGNRMLGRVGIPFEELLGSRSNLVELGKTDRKSTRLNSSHSGESRMPSSA